MLSNGSINLGRDVLVMSDEKYQNGSVEEGMGIKKFLIKTLETYYIHRQCTVIQNMLFMERFREFYTV